MYLLISSNHFNNKPVFTHKFLTQIGVLSTGREVANMRKIIKIVPAILECSNSAETVLAPAHSAGL
jgi:hypothetical protein